MTTISPGVTYAVFDIDGTLVKGSLERGFILYLIRRRLLGWFSLWQSIRYLVRGFSRDRGHVFKTNKAYLAGLSTRRVAEEAGLFVENEWLRRGKRVVVDKLRAHVAKGDTVVLLSGTLSYLADAVATHLDVKSVIATICSETEGVFDTASPLQHPFGPAKARLLANWLQRDSTEVRSVVAYGDSIYDRFVFDMANDVICVDPDVRLRRLAAMRRYTILMSAP